MAERILNLYVGYSFTDVYWGLSLEEQKEVRSRIAGGLAPTADATHLYNVFPSRADLDFFVWSAWAAEAPSLAETAFTAYNAATAPLRSFIAPTQSLWGYTRQSTYSRGKSEQDMDPLEGPRAAYLVIYPFSKTKEWYLMSMDARQGMMNEHIKIGKQYFDIKQLLVYSFGLQDQEFVVSYEVEELERFSELVNALRSTEGRRHTSLDTPIIVGVHRTPEEFAS